MRAADLMTTEVVTVSPDTPTREIARALLEHRISAVPVVDDDGRPLGMVSEGDLIGRDEADQEARRDWWLALLAEGEALHPDFEASVTGPQRRAREVMSTPVVTVGESDTAAEIARVLAAQRIKRVPVLRDGKIVGIVSRADLLQALAAEERAPAEPPAHAAHGGLVGEVLTAIEDRFLGNHHTPTARAPARQPSEGEPEAADFRHLVADYEHQKAEHQDEARKAAAQRQRERVRELIDTHIADKNWQAILHRAREAAERGESEFLLLRFPAALCSDGGRAINAPSPDWAATLRGEAAEIYLRWKHELHPRGFHLDARVLDFPGGKPGDIGLFLSWNA